MNANFGRFGIDRRGRGIERFGGPGRRARGGKKAGPGGGGEGGVGFYLRGVVWFGVWAVKWAALMTLVTLGVTGISLLLAAMGDWFLRLR